MLSFDAGECVIWDETEDFPGEGVFSGVLPGDIVVEEFLDRFGDSSGCNAVRWDDKLSANGSNIRVDISTDSAADET